MRQVVAMYDSYHEDSYCVLKELAAILTMCRLIVTRVLLSHICSCYHTYRLNPMDDRAKDFQNRILEEMMTVANTAYRF